MDMWFTLFVTLAAVLGAVGVALVLMGYITTLLSCFSFGMRWTATVLLLPVIGGIWFAYAHRETHLKVGRQLLAGTVSLLVSLALVYGGPGQRVAQRAVEMEQIKVEQTAPPATSPSTATSAAPAR